MEIREGHLFMADLTGYTAFMTASELEHAGPVLAALLNTVIDEVKPPLEIANLEGDAVFFHAPEDRFISSQSLLEMCERIYFAFSERRRQMIANTSCPCRACANIAGLDLKILAHTGRFQALELAGRRELSGPDVILLHRMAKSGVRDATGIDSYLVLTEAAAERTGVAVHDLAPYAETFEHFGEVRLLVHDLRAAWEAWQAGRDRVHIAAENAFWTGETRVRGALAAVWDCLVLPEIKRIWMDMKSVEIIDGPDGRLGVGADYHCVHEEADIRFRIVDWRPFDYFSAVERDPLGSGLNYIETWEIVEAGDDLIVRFNVDRPFRGDDAAAKAGGSEVEAIRGLYQEYGMPMLEGLRTYLDEQRA